MNTGFRGSAGARSKEGEALQSALLSALLKHHQFGILTPQGQGVTAACGDLEWSHAMPQSWARGTMLVKSNTVARGHSSVSLRITKTLMALLRNETIPLHGSILAAGDLTPLAYIAGAVTGSPDIYV